MTGEYSKFEDQRRWNGMDLLADVQLVFYDGIDVLPAHGILSGLWSRLFLVEKLLLVSWKPSPTCTSLSVSSMSIEIARTLRRPEGRTT